MSENKDFSALGQAVEEAALLTRLDQLLSKRGVRFIGLVCAAIVGVLLASASVH